MWPPHFSRLPETSAPPLQDNDENKLIYTDLFSKYTEMVEAVIEARLKAAVPGFDMMDFMQMLDERREELMGDVFELLVSLGWVQVSLVWCRCHLHLPAPVPQKDDLNTLTLSLTAVKSSPEATGMPTHISSTRQVMLQLLQPAPRLAFSGLQSSTCDRSTVVLTDPPGTLRLSRK